MPARRAVTRAGPASIATWICRIPLRMCCCTLITAASSGVSLRTLLIRTSTRPLVTTRLCASGASEATACSRHSPCTGRHAASPGIPSARHWLWDFTKAQRGATKELQKEKAELRPPQLPPRARARCPRMQPSATLPPWKMAKRVVATTSTSQGVVPPLAQPTLLTKVPSTCIHSTNLPTAASRSRSVRTGAHRSPGSTTSSSLPMGEFCWRVLTTSACTHLIFPNCLPATPRTTRCGHPGRNVWTKRSTSSTNTPLRCCTWISPSMGGTSRPTAKPRSCSLAQWTLVVRRPRPRSWLTTTGSSKTTLNWRVDNGPRRPASSAGLCRASGLPEPTLRT
mmetsp:Transcript_55907/g.98007  ORF Transcript_55907/g.98007 Transcript_55907/m.98007 type:complete len:338 (+) Transcript_55907:1981-2994(+)